MTFVGPLKPLLGPLRLDGPKEGLQALVHTGRAPGPPQFDTQMPHAQGVSRADGSHAPELYPGEIYIRTGGAMNGNPIQSTL